MKRDTIELYSASGWFLRIGWVLAVAGIPLGIWVSRLENEFLGFAWGATITLAGALFLFFGYLGRVVAIIAACTEEIAEGQTRQRSPVEPVEEREDKQ